MEKRYRNKIIIIIIIIIIKCLLKKSLHKQKTMLYTKQKNLQRKNRRTDAMRTKTEDNLVVNILLITTKTEDNLTLY